MAEVLTQLQLLKEVMAALAALGLPGGLGLFMIGLRRRWWIWGSDHDAWMAEKEAQLQREREGADQWRSVAFLGTGMLEQTIPHLSPARSTGRTSSDPVT